MRTGMSDRTEELSAAARAIDPASLQQAKAAIAEVCEEYLRWADQFSRRLETVEPSELHKFARALSLTMLGHLPTRPGTCPFCIQYGKDRSCLGCGYAATHGRCDAEDAAFSLFIEAFQELGRIIYQDMDGRLPCSPEIATTRLEKWLADSANLAEAMKNSLESAPVQDLMKRKARYLDDMTGLLPLELFSAEVAEKWQQVRDRLKDYW